MAHETVLITGASSGIGRELAKCFAAEGSRLALVARSGGPLQTLADEVRKLYKIDARVFTVDLARPEAPSQLLSHLQTAGFKVDVLVNNAGFGAQGAFAHISLERQLQMLQLNIVTATHLTRLLLPGMIERRRGGVLNVASTAAFQAGPHMAVYYASKAYLLSFSEALTEEVAGTGVRVTALCPGPTATNFFAAAGIHRSRLLNLSSMSAAAVARIGHGAFRQGRAVAIAGVGNQLLALSVRLVPRFVARRIAGSWNAAK
jgi:short-subunit dehydrogenase